MKTTHWAFIATVAGFVSLLSAPSQAAHVTDGVFTTPVEWNGPFAVKAQFSAVQAGAHQNGGSSLYVERVPGATDGGILYLMYDFTNSPSLGLSPANSFFDVFFQVPNEGDDYVVRIHPGNDNFQAVEKASGTTSSQNPDGSFNLSDPLWTPLDAGDLAVAQFHSAIGFGPSPDSATPHLQAEFQLTVQKSGFDGFYSPEPAFWSASVGEGGVVATATSDDPPISSAIFQLDPTGGPLTFVFPVLGPDGGPISQPNVPEPTTALLACFALTAALSAQRPRMRTRSTLA